MKLKKIIETLKENTSITAPIVRKTTGGYELVVCSKSWLLEHTYNHKDTDSRIHMYYGYIGSDRVTIEAHQRWPNIIKLGLVVLFHFKYEDGRHPLSNPSTGPTNIYAFVREMKKLNKNSTEPMKTVNPVDTIKSISNTKPSPEENPRRANHFYVFFQDVSYGHTNDASTPIEFKLKQDAIDRANDSFTYDNYDKNGVKTWVEDSDGNTIYTPPTAGSFISKRR